jgi:hypothetical protein
MGRNPGYRILESEETAEEKALFIAIMDDPYAFILYRKNIPQCLISFDFDTDTNNIHINQEINTCSELLK